MAFGTVKPSFLNNEFLSSSSLENPTKFSLLIVRARMETTRLSGKTELSKTRGPESCQMIESNLGKIFK